MGNDIGYAKQAAESAPMAPLPGAVSALGGSINYLEESIYKLRDRISAVMTPQAPVVQAESKTQLAASPPPVSDTTANVACQSRRVDSLTMQLNEMLMRLET